MAAADVTPDTPLSLVIYHLEQSVLDCGMFRAIVADPTAEYGDLATWADDPTKGGDTSFGRADAAEKIVWYTLDEERYEDDESAGGPRAIIRHAETSTRHVGNLRTSRTGALTLVLELPIPTAYTDPRTAAQDKNIYRWGLSIAGRIEAELVRVQNTAGRLQIERIEFDPEATGIIDPAEDARPEEPYTFQAVLLVYHQGM